MIENEYLTPKQTAERFPMFTVAHLAQLRYTGSGPKYLRPTPRRIIYRLSDVIEWIESSERTGTAEVAR